MSKQFKEIRQRAMKQLGELFPFIVDKPDVKKSSSLQPVYKVIPCPPLPPKLFKQALESITSNSFKQQDSSSPYNNITTFEQTLKRVQQYFTACINILEHNEKVRQKYQVNAINGQKTIQRESKQLSELIRACGIVKSKGQLVRLIKQRGGKIMQAGSSNNMSKQQQVSDKRLSVRNIKCQQPGQLYLPAHPDQYSFITRISQDQYLILYEQVLQKLLIQLTTVSNISQQLSITDHNYSLQQIKQILTFLAVDEMFCVQDNKFNRLVRFVLEYVHGVVQDQEDKRNDVQRRRSQLRQSLLRVYYLQFMVRSELQIICAHLRAMIETNQRILLQNNSQKQFQTPQLSIKSISTQLQQTSHLNQSLTSIFQYLTQHEQQIFPLLYKRKLKKFILKYQQTQKLIILASRINRTILMELGKHGGGLEEVRSQKQLLVGDNPAKVLAELQALITSISHIQQKINTSFPSQSNPKPSNVDDRQCEQHTSLFSKLYRRLQRFQLKLSQIDKQASSLQLGNNNSTSIPQKIDSTKSKILTVEYMLIDRFKAVIRISNHSGLTLDNFLNISVSNNNVFARDYDDSQSILSGVSSSSASKSTIFQPYQILQSDIILLKPTLISQSYIPKPANLQQLIKTVDDFVTNQLVQNQLLGQQLQDAKNVNFQMLNCIIYHVDNNIKDIITRSKINQSQQSSKQRQINQSQSPQKNKQKAKISRDNRFRKSPKKGHPQKGSTSKQQQSLNKQQSSKFQILQNLKEKLIFIRQILCPQISQCRISRIFSQTLQIEIFQKVCYIISTYKQKIFTQQVYSDADKFKLRNFLQQRVNFLNTVLKNQKQLLEIFNFIKIFSQQKVKFQLTDERTFQIILRALLASKQVQAYRKENVDLCKLGKLSSHGVRMLEQEVYVPFMLMFKSLLKIISSQESTVKGLQEMLECIKQALQIKESIKHLFINEQQDNTIKNIQNLIESISTIKQFSIFKYTRMQAICRILRLSLSIQIKSPNQSRQSVILNYLKSRLLQKQDGSSQPLLG